MPDSQLAITEQLWNAVLEAAAGMQIHPGCEQNLRQFVENGVAKMRAEHRISPADVDIARANVRQFVMMMKASSRAHGYTWLGEDTFDDAKQSLIQTAGFVLWPFWPPR